MTSEQKRAIWEMWRQGLHRLAARAEQSWANGEAVVLDASMQVPRLLKRLVDQCNRQSIGESHLEEDNQRAG